MSRVRDTGEVTYTFEPTIEQRAVSAATLAARQVIAQSKNPRTTLGKMGASSVAYHAAIAAIDAYQKVMKGAQA
jgi:hypothetical protein